MSNLLDILRKVYTEEIERFIYISDLFQYKISDVWTKEINIPDIPNKFKGDCEDFALACRKNLRRRGINNSRLVLCLTEEKEYHMVLEVEGWVFDCRQDDIIPRNKLKYGWISISGYSSDNSWRSLV